MKSCPSCGGPLREHPDRFVCLGTFKMSTLSGLRDQPCGWVMHKPKYHGMSTEQKALAMEADSMKELRKIEQRRNSPWPR